MSIFPPVSTPDFVLQVIEAASPLAIGWDCFLVEPNAVPRFRIGPLEPWKPFQPDIDWNHAMWLAEQAGLFRNDCSLFQGEGGTWVVLRETGLDAAEMVTHSSGPAAVCNAIIQFKKENEE